MPDGTYCVLADLGLATQTAGHVSMCNQSRVFWRDRSGQLLNLSQNSVEDAWTSPTREEISQALKSGIQHPNCEDCWNEEAAGRHSQRIIHNENFRTVVADVNQPRVIILKPGNACNLACRHCAPHTSSAWYQDYFRVEYTGGGQLSDFVQEFKDARISYHDHSELWTVLSQWSPRVVYWDLYGAEPLLIKPLLSLLKQAAQCGWAHKQSIHINTNGTIWHDDFNSVFEKFQSVHIGVSIDGIAEQFEYMRYPAQWNQVLTNLDRYQELQRSAPGVCVDICITVSLLNVWYLPQCIDFFQSRGLRCGINLLHYPAHLNMRIAPDAVKQHIQDRFRDRRELDSVVNFLKLPFQNSKQSFEKFVKITQSYDHIRGQEYSEVFAEFWNLLKRETHNDIQ